jgi:diguanylate cyclase (GGDEF)-like protein
MDPRKDGKPPGFKERYAVLLDIGRILTGTLRPDHLYRAIYEQTARVLDATAFVISLYDPADDSATVVFHTSEGRADRLRTRFAGSESEAIREQRPILQQFAAGTDIDLPWLVKGRGRTRCVISAPIQRNDRVLGLIAAQHDRAGRYDADDVELLAAVADLAAVALENAHHVEELDRRRHEAERLEQIARALTASLEPREVIDRITAAAHELSAADSVSVWLMPSPGIVELATARGDRALPIGTRFPLPEVIYNHAIVERKAFSLERLRENPLVPAGARRLVTFETALAVPLVADDQALGFLVLAQEKQRRFTKDEVNLMERLSFQASIALANARLHEQLRSVSLTDPLTGLPNRRHLELFLDREYAAAQRGRRLAVVLFDLDEFKQFNDRAGHQAGDDALRSFARILLNCTRAMNLAARYGGDEFLCILADADRRGAKAHVRRVATAVQADPVLATIGVSAGVATYATEMTAPSELIRAADRDLYRQKEVRTRRRALAR